MLHTRASLTFVCDIRCFVVGRVARIQPLARRVRATLRNQPDICWKRERYAYCIIHERLVIQRYPPIFNTGWFRPPPRLGNIVMGLVALLEV